MRLLDELERIVDAARRDREQRRAERKERLRESVAAYIAEHPEASGNEVAREIRGRKRDVLRIVRDLRAPVPVPPEPPQRGGPA